MLNQAHSLCLQTRTMLLASPDQQDSSLEQALEQAAGKTVTGAVATAIAAALFERQQAELAMQWIDLALIVQADCIEALAVRATIESGSSDTLKAIATYRQIIAIAPAQVQAYREISLLYKNQRDWDAALWAADCALVICPHMADMCANRIDLLLRLQRDDEALRFLQALPAAIYDSPPLINARVNALNSSGRFDEASQILRSGVRRAMESGEFDFTIINQWLTHLVSSGNSARELSGDLKYFASCLGGDRRHQGLIASYAMIQAWLGDHAGAVLEIAGQHADFEALPDVDDDRAMRVFYRYLGQLARAHLVAPSESPPPVGTLHVLGESHCLSPANSVFPWHGQVLKASGKFVMGIQMHHLAQAGDNVYKQRVLSHLRKITDGSLLLTIGEIDCRPVEGMWRAAARGGMPLDDLMELTVNGYFSFLDQALCERAWLPITIQGVPAPGYDLTDRRDPGDKKGFIAMIRRVNTLLEAGARRRQWHFLNIHAATARQDGMGNGMWHLDRYHLSPSFYQGAMQWINNRASDRGGRCNRRFNFSPDRQNKKFLK